MNKAYTRQDAKAFKGVFCLNIDLANWTDRWTRIRKARIVIIAIIPRSKPKRAIARTFITSKSIFALWKFLGIIFIGKIKVWPYSESCVKSWSEKVPLHSDHMDLYHSGCTHWYQYRTFLSLLNLTLDKVVFLEISETMQLFNIPNIQSCIAFAFIFTESINAFWIFRARSAAITFIDVLKINRWWNFDKKYWQNLNKPDTIHYKQRNHHNMHIDMTQIHLCIQNIVGIYCSDPYQTRHIRLYQNTNNHLTYLILLNNWLHRCWWRMLETKCVDDNYKTLVTVLAVLNQNFWSPTSTFFLH